MKVALDVSFFSLWMTSLYSFGTTPLYNLFIFYYSSIFAVSSCFDLACILRVNISAFESLWGLSGLAFHSGYTKVGPLSSFGRFAKLFLATGFFIALPFDFRPADYGLLENVPILL